MAYTCVMCPPDERARFVFMDTENGETASSCEAHIFSFLEAMASYVMQTMGVEPTIIEEITEAADELTTPKAPEGPRKPRKPRRAADERPPDPQPADEPAEPVTADL